MDNLILELGLFVIGSLAFIGMFIFKLLSQDKIYNNVIDVDPNYWGSYNRPSKSTANQSTKIRLHLPAKPLSQYAQPREDKKSPLFFH